MVLGTTHIVRGADLEGELNWYVQLLHALGEPPTLCHLPPLVDGQGRKLAKSSQNGGRIALQLREAELTSRQARRWLLEQAYKNASNPTASHRFANQLALLDHAK